ncbi:unnamed protein product [Blepharisma stoltei]|uniref:SAGA-associated factor 11 n=1 Tax=Blepharisma stoltei TaxID=1481888 RepID=A0AAU9J8Y5_9CILI|nr:unnamed protein product [Blepharisma stoltei]
MNSFKDDIWTSNDPQILQQKIELLKIELEDSKNNENHLKCMYNTLMKNFTAKAENSFSGKITNELKLVREQHEKEIESIKTRHKRELEFRDIKEKDMQNRINAANAENMVLKQELEKINQGSKIKHNAFNYFCKKFENKLKEMNENYNKNIKIQRDENNQLRHENTKLKQLVGLQSYEFPKELKNFWDNSEQLDSRIQEIELENQAKIDKIEGEKIKAEETAEIWKKELEELARFAINQKSAKKLPISHNKTQTTLKMLSPSSKSPKNIINRRETKEFTFNKNLPEKQSGVDIIRSKSIEAKKALNYYYLLKNKEDLTEKLADRESEISLLRKKIAETKISAPSSPMSQSFVKIGSESTAPSFIFGMKGYPHDEAPYKIDQDQYMMLKKCQKIINSAYAIECENCRNLYITQKFYPHLQKCKNLSVNDI